ncbi:MAG: hypothetical protein AAFX58_11960 [Pseudomonadota bacterium]
MTRIPALIAAACFALLAQNALTQGVTEEAMATLESIEPIALSDADVKNWIAAARAFDEQKIDLDAMHGDSFPTRESMIGTMTNSAEVLAILDRHEFTPQHFADVSLNLMLAMGASEMAKHKAEVDQAMQELESMKDQLPPGQYEQLVKQVVGAQAMFRKAPPGNVELAQKYGPELAALGGN